MSARILRASDPGTAEAVLAALRADRLVALPTDTLYGLSCRARSSWALGRLAAAKGIGAPRGMVALVDRMETFAGDLAPDWDARCAAFLHAVWPAPVSAIVPLAQPVPWGDARDGRPTAAYRVPDDAFLRRLLGALGEPVVSTSANRTGEPPLHDAVGIASAFGLELDLVVDAGAAPSVAASTLLDCTAWPPRVVRDGAFDAPAALERFAAPAGRET